MHCYMCGTDHSGLSCPNCALRETIANENRKNREHAEKMERERQHQAQIMEYARQSELRRLEDERRRETRAYANQSHAQSTHSASNTNHSTELSPDESEMLKVLLAIHSDWGIKNQSMIQAFAKFINSVDISGESYVYGDFYMNGHYAFTANPLKNENIEYAIFIKDNINFKDIHNSINWFKSDFKNKIISYLEKISESGKFDIEIIRNAIHPLKGVINNISYKKEDEFISACIERKSLAGFIFIVLCMPVLVERLLQDDLSSAQWSYNKKATDQYRNSSSTNNSNESFIAACCKWVSLLLLSTFNATLLFVILSNVSKYFSKTTSLQALTWLGLSIGLTYITRGPSKIRGGFWRMCKLHGIIFSFLLVAGIYFK